MLDQQYHDHFVSHMTLYIAPLPDMFGTQCLLLVVHFGIKIIRIPCIRPTVHLICGHSRATVGLYAGETVYFVLSLGNAKHLGECRDCVGKTAAD